MAPTTTTTINTAVVPKHITVAYVNAVLAKLDHIYGDVGRSMVATHRLTTLVFHDLGDIYTQALGNATGEDLSQTLAGGLENIRSHPGDPKTTVVKLITASPTCIFAQVKTNWSKVAIRHVGGVAQEFEGLIPNPRRNDPSDVNKTAWIWFFDLVNLRPLPTPDQCPYRPSRYSS